MKSTTINYLVFFLFCGLSLHGFSQSNYYHPDDWVSQQQELASVKGNVKRIEIQTYAPDDNDDLGELLQMNYFEWDESDRVYRWEYTDFKIDIQFIQMFSFMDEDDQRMYQREHYNENGNLLELTTYEYDESHEDMVTKIFVDEYDEYLQEAPEHSFEIDVILDEDGVRRKDVTYKEDGSVRTEVEVKYNEMGLVSSKNRYRADGEWIWTDSIEYTPLYRKSRTLSIRPDTLNGGKKELVTNYVYNDDLQLIAMKVGDTELQFEYEYDEFGNWIKMKTYKLFDGAQQLYTIAIRDIGYQE